MYHAVFFDATVWTHYVRTFYVRLLWSLYTRGIPVM